MPLISPDCTEALQRWKRCRTVPEVDARLDMLKETASMGLNDGFDRGYFLGNVFIVMDGSASVLAHEQREWADEALRQAQRSDVDQLRAAISDLATVATPELLKEARRRCNRLKRKQAWRTQRAVLQNSHGEKGGDDEADASAIAEAAAEVAEQGTATPTSVSSTEEDECTSSGSMSDCATADECSECSSVDDSHLCSVCLDEEKSHCFVPCGHLCVCSGCVGAVEGSSRKCPICCAEILMAIKVWT